MSRNRLGLVRPRGRQVKILMTKFIKTSGL